MGRNRTNEYEPTPFSRRICQLQEEHGYTDQEVIEGVVDENRNPLITGEQAYKTHKTARSQPNNFQDMLRGYARFYDVSVDYLLEMTDSPTPEIGKVEEITGLGEQAVRRLTQLKDQYPDILAMVDAIIAGTEINKDIADYITLYNQIFEDYKDSNPSENEETSDDNRIEVLGLAAEMRKVQNRFFLTQALYAHWQRIVTAKLAPTFEKEKKMEEDQRKFEHTQKDFDAMCDIDASRQTIINFTVSPVEHNNDGN